jgi:alkanesulfonate monooxygenase SsuD/methylene tetrahydromethanopterin reductase-like flavin-dependent oxidoreductase (luciferase family)
MKEKTLKVGLLHLFEDPQGKTEGEMYEENIQLAEYADTIGLDTVWIAEHHFSEYGVMPSTQVFGTYIAARTKRIRIGTGVVVLPFHNPIRVAEEFAFLDVLSGGRLDFGIGRGYQPHEFEGYGIPIQEARERYDEERQIIRMAWETGEVNFEGKYYRFKKVTPRPRPLQKPHPPIFGASFNPDTIKYQALQKNHLLFTPLLAGPEKLGEYREHLEKVGEDPSRYRKAGLVFVYVADTKDRALKEFEHPCMWYFRTFTKYISREKYPDTERYYKQLNEMYFNFLTAYDKKELSFQEIVDSGPFQHGFLIGSPKDVNERLDMLLELYPDLTDLLCWTRLGGLEHRLCMRSMKLLVEKVLKPRRLLSPA